MPERFNLKNKYIRTLQSHETAQDIAIGVVLVAGLSGASVNLSTSKTGHDCLMCTEFARLQDVLVSLSLSDTELCRPLARPCWQPRNPETVCCPSLTSPSHLLANIHNHETTCEISTKSRQNNLQINETAQDVAIGVVLVAGIPGASHAARF